AEANRGFFVKKISLEEVQDIYGTFEKIELLALSEAIQSGDVAWEGAILAALHRLHAIEKGSSPADSKAWLQANYDFHRSLVSGCRSPCLLKIREDLYHLFERYCHLSFLTEKQTLQMNHEHHVRIAQAVIQRQSAEACQLMQEHLRTSFESVIHHLF
ncbi:MAG: FCD domain-containing protein, partial [Parachlamydia sp.]|nr:FCD domain-containing protein [Parachlamydia sp.]